jgi:hypothetical protein
MEFVKLVTPVIKSVLMYVLQIWTAIATKLVLFALKAITLLKAHVQNAVA